MRLPVVLLLTVFLLVEAKKITFLRSLGGSDPEGLPLPVVSRQDTALENQHGFEGGRVVQVEDAYFLFTAELYGDCWAQTRIAWWRSEDLVSWKRGATLFTSTASNRSDDPRCSLWEPIPFFHVAEDRWHLFYTGYTHSPACGYGTDGNGTIFHAVSKMRGHAGIAGPYLDIVPALTTPASFGGTIPGAEGGHLGVDSFHPYWVGDTAFALVGHMGMLPASALKNFSYLEQCYNPDLRKEGVTYANFGLVTATRDNLEDWHWLNYSINVSPKGYYENPVVSEMPWGGYAAVVDACAFSNIAGYNESVGFGVMFSKDGYSWGELHMVAVPGGVRAPLGLIAEEGRLRVLYTFTESHKPFHEPCTAADFFAIYGAELAVSEDFFA